ncbi:MAG: hypothetical protein ACO3SO_06225 [Luteolibacter sp.]
MGSSSNRLSNWLYYTVGALCVALSVSLVFFPDDPPQQSQRPPSSGITHSQATPDPLTPLPSEAIQGNPPRAAFLSPENLPQPRIPPMEFKEAQRRAWVFSYCEKLTEASYQHDLASLELLLAELGSSELEIAESAYQNLMARHDRRAIPYLQSRMQRSGSAFERKHLLKLIEFLQTKGINESNLLDRRSSK